MTEENATVSNRSDVEMASAAVSVPETGLTCICSADGGVEASLEELGAISNPRPDDGIAAGHEFILAQKNAGPCFEEKGRLESARHGIEEDQK
jgi:hypothetical protein